MKLYNLRRQANEKGFTLIELMIIIAIIIVISFIIVGNIVNNRGATERRAIAGAQSFLQQNEITSKRLTCAGDSNNDGYGTCNIITDKNEKIILNCPTNFFDVKLFDATQCKEVFQNFNITGMR